VAQEITSESLVAYDQCLRKAFLLLHGDPIPSRHQYELILSERAAANRATYVAGLPHNDLQGCTSICDMVGGTPKSDDASDAPPHLVASCDALVRMTSAPGKSHATYEPHLVVGTHTISKEQKLTLAFAGYVAGQTGRRLPTSGLIVPCHGKPKRVKLQPLYPRVRLLVSRLRELAVSSPSATPPLMLNKNCPTCPFRQSCLREAERDDNLSLLDRITARLSQRYARKGIFTIAQLSYLFKPRRRRRPGRQPPSFNVEIQALAIRTNKVYLHETPNLPQQPVEMYLDIEGIPDRGFQYLIGLLIREGDSSHFRSFWADSPEDEPRMVRECLEAVAEYPNAPIYHYGSYERRAFQQASRKHALECGDLQQRLVNVNSLVYGKVYFPSRSNGLKDLGRCVGATWSAPDASGVNSLVWRHRWEDSRDDKYRDMLLTYNREDCNALWLLITELRDLAETAESRSDVDFADSPKLNATEKGADLHRTLDSIVASAHADGRRPRIQIRHGRKASVSVGRKGGARKGHPGHVRMIPARAGKIVRVRRKLKCPQRYHKGVDLIPTDALAKHTVIDLVFRKGGCRKAITTYVGRKTRCPRCHREYLPPAISRFGGRLFGHALCAWAVYQRIALRLPYRAIRAI